MINFIIKSIFLIFPVSFIIFFLSASFSFASTLSLSPGSTNIPKDSIVRVSIKLNTQGESINGVSAFLSYPKDLLEVVSISYGSSAFDITAESSYGGGSIKISRGSIAGVTGNAEGVATINFRGKAQGTATVSFINGSGAPRTFGNTDSLNLGDSTNGIFKIGPAKPTIALQAIAITNVLVSSISTNSATITWTTDIESDSAVDYGLEQDKYILSSYDKKLVKEHKIVIQGNLIPGETFYFRVESQSLTGVGIGRDMTFQLKGYDVKITVLDLNRSPVPNAEVTLHSSPTRKITDQQGVAVFTDISPTRHLVVIKSKDLETSKEIDVKEGAPGEFTLTINTSRNNNTFPVIFFVSLAIAICLAGLGIIILRRKLSSTSNSTNPTPKNQS